MPTKDLTALAQEIDRDLRAVREIVRRPLAMEIARGHLTGPQQSAMAALVTSPDGMSLKALSQHLGLAHSTTSGIVDRLEKRGMIMREQHESDRRLTRITVSDEVRRFLQEKLPTLTIHPLVEALRHAKPDERSAITVGLKTLRTVLERRERTG